MLRNLRRHYQAWVGCRSVGEIRRQDLCCRQDCPVCSVNGVLAGLGMASWAVEGLENAVLP